MDLKEELAKLTLGQIVTATSLLIGSLALIVFREILAEKWAQVTAGLSTRGLSAALGLALIAIVIETTGIAYLLYLLYRQKPKIADPPMLKQFGVLWDFDLNPHCPVDKTPMAFFSHGLISDHKCDYLRCPACDVKIPLWDSVAGGLGLNKAKQLVEIDVPFKQMTAYKRIKSN
jgi:hypothetical protein